MSTVQATHLQQHCYNGGAAHPAFAKQQIVRQVDDVPAPESQRILRGPIQQQHRKEASQRPGHAYLRGFLQALVELAVVLQQAETDARLLVGGAQLPIHRA
jgi:hypothetical protein